MKYPLLKRFEFLIPIVNMGFQSAKSQMLSYSDISDRNSIDGTIIGSLRTMSDENLDTLDRSVNLELQRALSNHVET